MTLLGAALLWFGWFGFNAGSALTSGTLAVSAFISTHMAAAAGALAWAVLEWVLSKRPTALGIISGAIAGLATVTPAAGYVTPAGAILIGFLTGIICYFSVVWVKARLGYDDSLDAFGVHGVGGMFGVLMTGILATTAVNPDGADGLAYGHAKQLLIQFLAMIICGAFSFVVSWGLLKLVDRVVGLRVSPDHENIGLDLTQHRESAYTIVG